MNEPTDKRAWDAAASLVASLTKREQELRAEKSRLEYENDELKEELAIRMDQIEEMRKAMNEAKNLLREFQYQTQDTMDRFRSLTLELFQ